MNTVSTNKPMWYVIQVKAGEEKRTLNLIGRLVDEALIKECFIAQYEVKKKYQGVWKLRTEIFFPGYLFVFTEDAERLAHAIAQIPTFTRLLGNESQFIPLSTYEIALIESFMGSGERIVQMSEGIIENDKVIITRGPLMNHTAIIKKVDRHKRLAYLQAEMFGQIVKLKVGLEIIRKSVTA